MEALHEKKKRREQVNVSKEEKQLWKTARQDVGWLSVGRVMQALKERRDQDAWKVMIAFTKEQGT